MIDQDRDPANRLEKGEGDVWYVFYHSEAASDDDGRARAFSSKADATEYLLRCEAAGRMIH
jgi:hypothetical protein